MFLDPTGETVFYRRRIEGHDSLRAFRPDGGPEVHAEIAASQGRIGAWPTPTGYMLLCRSWPRDLAGLRIEVVDMNRASALLQRSPGRINELLTDIPSVTEFSAERRQLPEEVFRRLQGWRGVVPGLHPSAARGEQDQGPVLYVLDGRDATCCVTPLPFPDPTAIPTALYEEPGGDRLWLSFGDSNHLLVLDAETLELRDDVVWPVEEQALARLAFHPARGEVWISALTRVFVYDLQTMRQVAEIPVEEDLRWHRGERVRGFLGAVCFRQDGARALVARPLSGDIIEVDVRTRKKTDRFPLVVDPLELLPAPGHGRVYVQSLRNGNVSWFPYR